MPLTSEDVVDQLSKLYQFSGAGTTLWFALFDEARLVNLNCTVAEATGTFTAAGHNYVANTRVRFSTTGTLPGGLVANQDYFISSPATGTFRVATSSGGTAIASFTDPGTGTLTVSEQTPTETDPLTVWARLEANYQGSARQAGAALSTNTIRYDSVGRRGLIDGVLLRFTPTTAALNFRWWGLIIGGVVTTGSSSGRLRFLSNEFSNTQTIARNNSFARLFTPQMFLGT
jgi:hypothetical protein